VVPEGGSNAAGVRGCVPLGRELAASGADLVCVSVGTGGTLAGGRGPDAVMAPEMAAFAAALGFRFRAHAIGHHDRKGRVERPFSWIESNFLAGREFTDFDDLNRQVLTWCREIANAKPKRVLGMSPEAAYVIEKPHLQPLPAAIKKYLQKHVFNIYCWMLLYMKRILTEPNG